LVAAVMLRLLAVTPSTHPVKTSCSPATPGCGEGKLTVCTVPGVHRNLAGPLVVTPSAVSCALTSGDDPSMMVIGIARKVAPMVCGFDINRDCGFDVPRRSPAKVLR